MAIDGKPISQITEADIADLITNAVEEGREIDYKESVKIGTDSEKKEFLADVSSFANASGGHLLVGIAEERGRPTAFKPLTISNWDAERRRLESLLRDGLAPRIRVEFAAVPVATGGFVIVLRIPRSWNSPHMVTFQHNGRFYSRNSAGKYQLDVEELRAAFSAGAEIGSIIRTFQQNRLSDIVAGEGPARLADSGKIVLHCYPYSAAGMGTLVDIHKAYKRSDLLMPMADGCSISFNLDGVIAFSGPNDGRVTSYFQLFRDGRIEAVDASIISPLPAGGLPTAEDEMSHLIPGVIVAARTIKCLEQALALFRLLGVSPPVAVLMTVIGVKGYKFAANRISRYPTIDRDVLPITPEIIQTLDAVAATVMQPILDALWNAAGLPRCQLYNDAGKPTQELSNHLSQC